MATSADKRKWRQPYYRAWLSHEKRRENWCHLTAASRSRQHRVTTTQIDVWAAKHFESRSTSRLPGPRITKCTRKLLWWREWWQPRPKPLGKSLIAAVGSIRVILHRRQTSVGESVWGTFLEGGKTTITLPNHWSVCQLPFRTTVGHLYLLWSNYRVNTKNEKREAGKYSLSVISTCWRKMVFRPSFVSSCCGSYRQPFVWEKQIINRIICLRSEDASNRILAFKTHCLFVFSLPLVANCKR